MNTPYDYMVLQPGSVTIENGPVNQRMTEVWKGPWTELRKTAQLKTAQVFGFKVYPGIQRPPFETSADWKHEFDAPSVQVLNEDKTWIITDVEARQLDAGDMGTLTIQYETRGADTSTGGSASENTGIPKGGQQRRPTTWSLSFREYTLSPLAYADLSAVDAIQKCVNNEHPGTLEVAKKYNPAVTSATFDYTYLVRTGEGENDISAVVLEGEKNRKIYKYMLAGINPQFHSPIVSRDAYFALSAGDAMSCDVGNLDRIEQLPPNCPIYWREAEWRRIEDNINVT